MTIDRDTLAQFARDGWLPTLEPTQLMKLYDGYVGLIQLAPPDWQCRREHARWSIWFTGEAPIAHGYQTCLEFAARKVNRKVRALTGQSEAA